MNMATTVAMINMNTAITASRAASHGGALTVPGWCVLVFIMLTVIIGMLWAIANDDPWSDFLLDFIIGWAVSFVVLLVLLIFLLCLFA